MVSGKWGHRVGVLTCGVQLVASKEGRALVYSKQ